MNKVLLIVVALSCLALAQTANDSLVTLKNVSPPAIGTTVSTTVMQNGTIGGLTWSSVVGTASALTVGPHQSACNLGDSVTIGGMTYQPAQPSQSFIYNNNSNFTTIRADIPGSHHNMSVSGCFIPNTTVNNLNDMIAVFDVLGHYVAFQIHNGNCANLETDGSGTLHSGCITVVTGTAYRFTFIDSEDSGTAQLAIYQPTYPYTQVGSTVTVAQKTGANLSAIRLGNNEVGVANVSTIFENLQFDYTNAVFPLGVGSQYAPWAGILSPTRAIDWRNAGVVGGIPARATVCSTLNPGVTSSQINTALSSCPVGQTVFLNAGTYNGLGMITIPSNKTLRGAGADLTHLNFSSASGCTGQLTLICFAGDNTDKSNRRNQTNLSGNFFPGSTALIFATVANLKVANPAILDQADDTTDAGGIVVSDTQSNMPSVAPGVTGPRSLEGNGGGSQTSGRQQQQIVTVVSCGAVNTPGASCSGTNVLVTFSPGLYMPNWDATRSPQAWWSNTPHEGGGVENLSIDSGSDTNAAMVFKWLNTKNTYITGVRANSAYRAHVQMQYASHGTIQHSYFFLNQGGGPTNYGIECYGCSDVAIIDNIFQAVTGPIPLNSAAQGNVIAYNYFTNIYYNGSAGWNNPFANEHTAGAEFNLIESNVGDGWDADVFHGTHHFNSFFRNRFIGTQLLCYGSGATYATTTYIPCNNNRFGLQLRSGARFHNAVANVIGTSGINTTYASTAGDRTVYTLNNGNSANGVTVPDDPNVTTTLLRWANWDVINGTRFVSGEIPNAPIANVQTPFGNFLPTVGNVGAGQTALPASLYYNSQPSWWPVSKPWPPIGPDVTGGNIAGVGGHAYTIPAQDCAAAIGIPADGTGPIQAFNANCSTTPAPISQFSGSMSGTIQ